MYNQIEHKWTEIQKRDTP